MFSWDKAERANLTIESHYAPGCRKGIWYQFYDEHSPKETLTKNRKNKCFFVNYTPGMMFPAADELLKTQREKWSVKRAFLIGLSGLIIALLHLIWRILDMQ